MKKITDLLPAHLRFLLSVHLILLGIYTLFRSITLAYNRPTYLFQIDRSISLWKAFRIGLQFDITVASYALLIPYILLSFAYIKRVDNRRLFKFVRLYCGGAILISFIICAADVPYFSFFNSRINTATVHWKNNLQVAKFLLTEIKYYPVLLASVLAVWSISRLVRTLWNRIWAAPEHNLRQKISATALASVMLLWGIWGGATPKTPDMKPAIFSNDGFINQLTLNPVHTWFDSYFDFDINVLSLKKAMAKVKSALRVANDDYPSPIAKERTYAQNGSPRNVVLILMESMSADRMGIFGNPDQLTPGLDSLARNSLFFDNCYSNGIHTNAGIFASLYGMPIVMMQHPMLNGVSEHRSFSGLPVTLRDMGYQTTFFCTHPKTFDNLDVFLERNGFDRISDQYDYPPSQVANSWGIGDETLMAHTLHTLDSLHADPKRRPFFAGVLTITAHPPYTLPAFTRFKPRSADPVKATYEYADWAIKSFMDSCARKPWYDNTIFVLVGDHGVNMPTYKFDVPLSYNHIPLIIHAPGIFTKPEVRHDLANQTDIFPTVMGLLRKNYVQNTLGYDLLREKRPFAFFSQDYKLGVMNEQFLYVARKSGKESLYNYRSPAPRDLINLYPALADSMKNYACSHLQVAQWLTQQELVGPMKPAAKKRRTNAKEPDQITR